MAAVYWLSEAGEVEPDSVCTVDYSDEGEAVEFAHQLYRSVHGSACRRPGFTIRSDAGETLYTWRWAAASAEDVPAEAAGKAAPSRPATSLAPRYGHAMAWHGLRQRSAAIVTPLRGGLVALTAFPHLKPDRKATGAMKEYTVKLAAFWRQVSTAWRLLTRWETSIESNVSERVLRNGRPAVESLKAHRLG